MSDYSLNPGPNPEHWMDGVVRNYEYQQSLVSEGKDESLTAIIRIINYFRYYYSIDAPQILDIGCGPGSDTTLSKYILDRIPGSYVTGVDSSEQMIAIANHQLTTEYGQRFTGYISDFNTQQFWIPSINRQYHFIASFASLNYLADRRMYHFLKEIHDRLSDNGVLIIGMGSRSSFPRLSEMANQFRIEFTYNQLDQYNRPADFREFKASFEETDRKANANWHSYEEWLELLGDAGFEEVELVSHLWVRSIFVALK